MCCFKFSVPLAHNGVLFAPILSVVHLLHQINRRWERLTLNESSSSFSCIWQLWTKAVGVDFGTWPALASFACRALVVGENSLLRGAADRPVKPQNTLWNACTATFSWQAASSALQSYLIRSSKASSQCFSSLLLLWHSSQAILSGWEQSTHRGFSPRRASTNRLLDRSLASLIRGKWLENCSPWKAKVILGHHTPGRCEPWQAIGDVCPLFSQGRDRPCRDCLQICTEKAFVIGVDCPGMARKALVITLGHGSCVPQHKASPTHSSCAECEGNIRAQGDPHCTWQGQHLSLPHFSSPTTDESQWQVAVVSFWDTYFGLAQQQSAPSTHKFVEVLERKKAIMGDQKVAGEGMSMGNGVCYWFPVCSGKGNG